MTYTISYSPSAIRDLDRMAADILQVSGSRNTTLSYINELLDKVESKKQFPYSGAPLYFENLFTGYYFVVHKAYIAFYRLDGANIYVDRILQGKSDYARLLNIQG